MRLLKSFVEENTTSQNCTLLFQNLVQVPNLIEKDCSLLLGLFPQVMSLIYFILCCVGGPANIFEVFFFLKNLKSWKTTGVAIINLAVANIITLFSFVPYALYLNLNYNWIMGRLMCQITMSSITFGITANTTFICAISLDRFIAIVFPIKFRHLRTLRYVYIFSGFLWTIAVIPALSVFPNVQYKMYRGRDNYCGVLYKYNSTQFIISNVVCGLFNLFFPLAIIAVSYLKILQHLQQFYKKKRAAGNKEKTMKIISTVIAVYLTCWFPSQFLGLFSPYIYRLNCRNICMVMEIGNITMEFSSFLLVLNACIDPLIYRLNRPFLHCDFKFKSINCCCSMCFSQSPPPTPPTGEGKVTKHKPQT